MHRPLGVRYTPSATIDTPCQYPDALGVCGGDCAADADADGICDDAGEGTTDSTADNSTRRPRKTMPAARPEEEDTSTFLGLTYEEVAVDLVDDTRTYRVYAQFDGANHEVVSVLLPRIPCSWSRRLDSTKARREVRWPRPSRRHLVR